MLFSLCSRLPRPIHHPTRAVSLSVLHQWYVQVTVILSSAILSRICNYMLMCCCHGLRCRTLKPLILTSVTGGSSSHRLHSPLVRSVRVLHLRHPEVEGSTTRERSPSLGTGQATRLSRTTWSGTAVTPVHHQRCLCGIHTCMHLEALRRLTQTRERGGDGG